MRVVWTITSGIAFSTLLVVLPMIHVARWHGNTPSMVTLCLAALPFLVIALTALRSAAWAAIWLFPVAHLPVLVARPELTGPLVYSGVGGLAVLLILSGLGALWIGCALAPRASLPDMEREVPDKRLLRPVPVAATTAALAIWIAFLWPVLNAAQAGRPQASAVVVGVAVAVMVLVSGRWVIRDIGELRGDPRYRRRWTVALLRQRQAPTGRMWLSLALTAVGSLMVLVLFR